MKMKRPHHQHIMQVLKAFDAAYLRQHKIFFGGGTRISMELEEYRESVDIDFLCPNIHAYKAVRSQVLSNSLGALLQLPEKLVFLRDVRADRDAVRAFVRSEGRPIKLEFIHFDNYKLQPHPGGHFPVPAIDRDACFLTKLLANADRYADRDKKDIFDLCMMHEHWGDISAEVWQQVDEKYGLDVVIRGLQLALTEMAENQSDFIAHADQVLRIEASSARRIVEQYAPRLMGMVNKRNSQHIK